MYLYLSHGGPRGAQGGVPQQPEWFVVKAAGEQDQFGIAKQVWSLLSAKRRVVRVDLGTLQTTEVGSNDIPWPEVGA